MSVTLALSGDIIAFYEMGEAARSAFAVLNQSDLSFCNLELPLTESRRAVDKGVVIKGPPKIAQYLKDFDVDVVTIANNHLMDFGDEGLFDTMNALKDSDVDFVGAGVDLDASFRPVIKEVNGKKIGFLGIATTLANSASAGEHRPGVAPVRVLTKIVIDPVTMQEFPGSSPFVETEMVEDDMVRVEQEVARLAQMVDHVVVGVHWGILYGWRATFQEELADYQSELAHRLVDAGAKVVVGNHPHYPQGIEVYKGCPIFYSLGLFNMHHPDLHGDGDSAKLLRAFPPYKFSVLLSAPITQFNFTAVVEWDDNGSLASCALIPFHLDKSGESLPASADEAEHLLAHLQAGSEQFGTSISRDANAGREQYSVALS